MDQAPKESKNPNEIPEDQLNDFLETLKDYEPIIPDEITRYFISKGGVDTKDPRILRLFSVVTQKMISDIVLDAFTQQKMRSADGRNKSGSNEEGKNVLRGVFP